MTKGRRFKAVTVAASVALMSMAACPSDDIVARIPEQLLREL